MFFRSAKLEIRYSPSQNKLSPIRRVLSSYEKMLIKEIELEIRRVAQVTFWEGVDEEMVQTKMLKTVPVGCLEPLEPDDREIK
jgi:hypothetical protein